MELNLDRYEIATLLINSQPKGELINLLEKCRLGKYSKEKDSFEWLGKVESLNDEDLLDVYLEVKKSWK